MTGALLPAPRSTFRNEVIHAKHPSSASQVPQLPTCPRPSGLALLSHPAIDLPSVGQQLIAMPPVSSASNDIVADIKVNFDASLKNFEDVSHEWESLVKINAQIVRDNARLKNEKEEATALYKAASKKLKEMSSLVLKREMLEAAQREETAEREESRKEYEQKVSFKIPSC